MNQTSSEQHEPMTAIAALDLDKLTIDIKSWATDLGFQQIGISDIDLEKHGRYLQAWLEKNFHGEMSYMLRHGDKRSRPDLLLPGTIRVLSARMDYLPDAQSMQSTLDDSNAAYISRYALGRDYHKLMRKRLAQLALKIDRAIEEMESRANEDSGQTIIAAPAQRQYRAFVDSAPVLERALAEKAGLGWIGKNTMLINDKAGSWFFLGEIFTNLPLPLDTPQTSTHCGSCRACLDICPTGAIVAPNQVDARRCISYLTIELRESIPVHLRSLMGNRIYGCDDCQMVCPWNKFAAETSEADFKPRHDLDSKSLLELFLWTEEEFLQRTEGSAIRRIGYDCWQRNIAVALGNAQPHKAIVTALKDQMVTASPMVQEHIEWALGELLRKETL